MFVLILTGVVIMVAILVAVWVSGLAGGIAPDSQPAGHAARTVAVGVPSSGVDRLPAWAPLTPSIQAIGRYQLTMEC